MDLAMHRSVYVSIDLVARLSIDLAIKSHCAYPLLCFKNRCLPELPLRYFPSSAYGCTIGVGDKTDAKRRRDTDGSEKTPSCQRSNDNTGNNMVTCCRLATTACTFSTSQLPKVARTCGVLYILTSKCASRHNSVHFFDISTSKSGPTLVCFVHFDFEMCFAPQRRALFQHPNLQKWREHVVFCTFWLPNVLRATEWVFNPHVRIYINDKHIYSNDSYLNIIDSNLAKSSIMLFVLANHRKWSIFDDSSGINHLPTGDFCNPQYGTVGPTEDLVLATSWLASASAQVLLLFPGETHQTGWPLFVSAVSFWSLGGEMGLVVAILYLRQTWST